MILDRAPPGDVVGGHAALRVAIDQLLDAWEALANDKRANAERLYYGYARDKTKAKVDARKTCQAEKAAGA